MLWSWRGHLLNLVSFVHFFTHVCFAAMCRIPHTIIFCSIISGLKEKLKQREYGKSFRQRKKKENELKRCSDSVSYSRDLSMSNLTDLNILTTCLVLLYSHITSCSSGWVMRFPSGLSMDWHPVTLTILMMLNTTSDPVIQTGLCAHSEQFLLLFEIITRIMNLNFNNHLLTC